MNEGADPIRQRMRAPLRFAVPPRRTSQHGVALRSAATARRRVAVKSSARGSPQISPITQERAEHLSPSSIAHSAPCASRASTWMRSQQGSPGGCTRPHSAIAIRSWTQRTVFAGSTCASRNPAQPPSRGWVAKSSQRVGPDGAGKRHRSPSPLGRRSNSAGPEHVRTAPPATRDKPLATRLTTFLFYFCSFPATPDRESMGRLGFPHPDFAGELFRATIDRCTGYCSSYAPYS